MTCSETNIQVEELINEVIFTGTIFMIRPGARTLDLLHDSGVEVVLKPTEA